MSRLSRSCIGQWLLSTSEEDSPSRNWTLGCGYPCVAARLCGHEALTFPYSFSSEKVLRESKSNVLGPDPGMERSLFVTGGSPEPRFTLHKILETRPKAVVACCIVIVFGEQHVHVEGSPELLRK